MVLLFVKSDMCYHRIAQHYFSQSNQYIIFCQGILTKIDILILLANCLTYIKIKRQGTIGSIIWKHIILFVGLVLVKAWVTVNFVITVA